MLILTVRTVLMAQTGGYLITTVAGDGTAGFGGDGGLALYAELNLAGYSAWSYTMPGPASGIAVDGSGDVFVADTLNNRIREVTPDGRIATIAGTGAPGFSGDGGPAVAAQLSQPTALAVDNSRTLYVLDQYNGRIRRVSLETGIISTYAGNPAVCNPGRRTGDCQ
jgi:sugar lactone lactonase YvrE